MKAGLKLVNIWRSYRQN